MDKNIIEIKTIAEHGANSFDAEVNNLISKGFKIISNIVIAKSVDVGGDYVWYTATLALYE